MKAAGLFWSFLVAAILISGQSVAQSPSVDVVPIWLQVGCMDGDTGQLAMQLVQQGSSAVPALIIAAENGPDSGTLLEIQSGAAARFADLQSWVVPNGAQVGLDTSAIQLVQSQTQSQFVADAVQDAKLAVQSRALAGLGLIADADAIRELLKFATDSTSPLQGAARRALAGPFSAFSAKLELSGQLGFELKATFALSTKSLGIDPLGDSLKLQLGNFVGIIPPRSFVSRKNGGFTFEGVMNGADLQTASLTNVNVELRITPLGNNSFEFKAEGRGVDLTALTNPVTVALTIGNDTGLTTVSAEHD